MDSVRTSEELCSDLVWSALSKMKLRQDALEYLVKALQRKVKIVTDTVLATGIHKQCTPSEDTSTSVESCRENPNFAELFRLREENFELKREIQRLDHALQIAKDLDLDVDPSSPLVQNTKRSVNFHSNSDALMTGSTQCEEPKTSCESCTKYVQFESEVAQTRMDSENPYTNGCGISSHKERHVCIGSAPSYSRPKTASHASRHGEKHTYAKLPDRSCTLPGHEHENFSAIQEEDACKEAPPTKKTGRSDRIKYMHRPAQLMLQDNPSYYLPKRTREDIRQQLLEDAFLVLQKSGGRYIKDSNLKMRQTLIILLVLAVIGAALVDARSDFKRRRMTPNFKRRRMTQGTHGKGENVILQQQEPKGHPEGPGKVPKSASSWNGKLLWEGQQTHES